MFPSKKSTLDIFKFFLMVHTLAHCKHSVLRPLGGRLPPFAHENCKFNVFKTAYSKK